MKIYLALLGVLLAPYVLFILLVVLGDIAVVGMFGVLASLLIFNVAPWPR